MKGARIYLMSRVPRVCWMSRVPRVRSGQISVLIVLSLIPLFTLFAFAVNIGMLVNAKISLQNAADLAAYAGAATQARQMTAISHVNYMMRQTYKRFLFRYYVLGNYALGCFPKADGKVPQSASSASGTPCSQYGLPDHTLFNFINPGASSTGFPGIPVVCVNLSKESNPCQLGGVVKTVKPPAGASMLNPVMGALSQAAEAIAEIQKAACHAHKLMNYEIGSKWLYGMNTEPDLKTAPYLNDIVAGIGLVPEQVLNYNRIKTLQSYINEGPQTLDKKKAESLETDGTVDIAVVERSVLAFKTAIGNLNENVFRHDQVKLQELQPENMLTLAPPAKFKIHLPVVMFESTADNCTMGIEPLVATPYFGVYKDPTSLDVFYAVKLTAKARILFNPFPAGKADEAGVDLVAYSAAKPFGSRIGPELKEKDFVKTMPYISEANPSPGLSLNIPTMDFGSEGGEDYSIASIGVLGKLERIMNFVDTTLSTSDLSGATSTVYTTNSVFNTKDFLARTMIAMLYPNKNEIGAYNIPVDVEGVLSVSGDPRTKTHGMTSYYQDLSQGQYYKLWAPLLREDQSNPDKLKEEIKAAIQTDFSSFQVGGGTSIQNAAVSLSAEFISQFDSYLGVLRSRENYRVARIVDPVAARDVKTLTKQNTNNFKDLEPFIPGKEMPTNPISKYATSYVTHSDDVYFKAGRDGYSVKFIPLSYAVKAARGDLKGGLSEINAIKH